MDPQVGDLVQTNQKIYTSPIGVQYIPEGTVGIILFHTHTFGGKRFETYFSIHDQSIFLDEYEFNVLKKA